MEELLRYEEQLKYISNLLEEINRNLSMHNNKNKKREQMGRPTKEHIVKRYRKTYPEGRKMQCSRTTGLSIKTVTKYWDIVLKSDSEQELRGLELGEQEQETKKWKNE